MVVCPLVRWKCESVKSATGVWIVGFLYNWDSPRQKADEVFSLVVLGVALLTRHLICSQHSYSSVTISI